jgi:hypothetical protein
MKVIETYDGNGKIAEIFSELSYEESEFDYGRPWRKQLCLVNWFNNGYKIEIRDWPDDYSKGGYGIIFDKNEVRIVKDHLEKLIQNLEKENKELSRDFKFDFNSGFKNDDYHNSEYKFQIIKPYVQLTSNKTGLTKEMNIIFWDQILPWNGIKLNGLKVDFRYWPLKYDRGDHQGITLDSNSEIKKVIIGLNKYINGNY